MSRCIKCNRNTPSLIDTNEGGVCLLCYPEPTKAKRTISHEEADMQSDFFNKVHLFFNIPDKLIFAIPNGGSRNKIEAANLKRQGVKRGISDVILLIPKGGFASLCIELKTKKGRQSDDQKEFQRQAENCGSKYVIARSVGDAIEAVRDYLIERYVCD